MPGRDEDPRKILGVGPDAGDKEVRAAYLKMIKIFPPDRSPERFERVRDAYELLRDPRQRARWMLRSADPEAPLASLLQELSAERRFTGPGPWLAALGERS